MKPDFPITEQTSLGTLVKHSDYSLRSQRDHWLSLGREPQKSFARDAYEAKKAERGELVENTPKGCRVKWSNGQISSCLSYMIVTA